MTACDARRIARLREQIADQALCINSLVKRVVTLDARVGTLESILFLPRAKRTTKPPDAPSAPGDV